MFVIQNSGQRCRRFDVGVPIIVAITDQKSNKMNLVGSSDIKINLLYPDETTRLAAEASFVTDGSDGLIQYVTNTNDISQSGTYIAQGEVILPTGERRTSAISFSADDAIDYVPDDEEMH